METSTSSDNEKDDLETQAEALSFIGGQEILHASLTLSHRSTRLPAALRRSLTDEPLLLLADGPSASSATSKHQTINH